MNNGDDPAVPVMDEGEYGQHYGLTKREHFAAMAMQGMLSDSDIKATKDEFAAYAVNMADQLLKELDK